MAVAGTRRDHPQTVGTTGVGADCRGHLRRLRRAVAGPAGSEVPHPRALPQAARPAPAARVRSCRVGVDHVGVGALLACRFRDQDTDTAGALLRPAPLILATAVSDGLLSANPCHIRGAGNTKRAISIRPVTVPELVKLTHAMPAQYQAMVLLASWCALRFGELTELRRRDVDIDIDAGRGVIHVERAVVRTGGGFMVGRPKSEAGRRDVAIPPHLLEALQEHLA